MTPKLLFYSRIFVQNTTYLNPRHYKKTTFYIDLKLESGDDLDSTTGRMLAEIFNGVPGLDAAQLDKMLNAELTDLLMVTYLSQLANVQLTLNDKLKNAFAQTPESAERKIAGKNKPRATLN